MHIRLLISFFLRLSLLNEVWLIAVSRPCFCPPVLGFSLQFYDLHFPSLFSARELRTAPPHSSSFTFPQPNDMVMLSTPPPSGPGWLWSFFFLPLGQLYPQRFWKFFYFPPLFIVFSTVVSAFFLSASFFRGTRSPFRFTAGELDQAYATHYERTLSLFSALTITLPFSPNRFPSHASSVFNLFCR